MQTSDKIKEQHNSKLPLFLWLIALGLLISFFLLITSDFFKIGTVEVKENKYVSTKEILEIANINNNKEINVFSLDTVEIKERLLSDLRVSEVNITRKLPTTIVIDIKERKPVAFVEFKYGFVQIDKDALVFSVSKSISNINIPTIKGPILGNVHIGDQIENSDIKNILSYLKLLDEATLNSLKEISFNNDAISTITSDSILIKVGSLDRIEEKAALTISILKDIKDNKLKVEYIDLSYATPVIKIKQKETQIPKAEIPKEETIKKENNTPTTNN
ncbi:FtsQ-type POTRA domain-containing protein [Selenomonadales bacterium OttesenSCG-928-I06]|nr:FtsQ-type POTRA domain-containing protein [Selenomonadales bacterium OttesenSCG-928-I06]